MWPRNRRQQSGRRHSREAVLPGGPQTGVASYTNRQPNGAKMSYLHLIYIWPSPRLTAVVCWCYCIARLHLSLLCIFFSCLSAEPRHTRTFVLYTRFLSTLATDVLYMCMFALSSAHRDIQAFSNHRGHLMWKARTYIGINVMHSWVDLWSTAAREWNKYVSHCFLFLLLSWCCA